MPKTVRIHMHIKGVVQGVGFRPFVYNLAQSLGVKGWVNNTVRGVELEIEGEEPVLLKFSERMNEEAPPLALIEEITATRLAPVNYENFVIKDSEGGEEKFTLLSPDTATCPQCLEELKDPENRRYRYPFINCTNCGPRFTIIKDVPYDRSLTTMAGFLMCPDCQREYDDPRDRRFHAQPNACPACGPQVSLLDGQDRPSEVKDPVAEAVTLLKKGHILAVKGLGGYHLVCDAFNSSAVQVLRSRKNREAKPFAVMMPDMETVKKHCLVSREEETALSSQRRPIVLLGKKAGSPVAPEVAPGNRCLGVMLPYSPLHYLLFDQGLEVLVMTSGNKSGDAIEYVDREALTNLRDIADFFLSHNRDIHIRTDDSVVRIFRGKEMVLRRSRGYVPLPLKLPFQVDNILAVGGELKNTLCLTKGSRAFLSQHIGDLENLSNMQAFEQAVEHLQKVFNIRPRVVAYDLHPDYLSSKFAQEMGKCAQVAVQHHHAHVASCMAENGLMEEVIGVAFDGSGYGTDGNIWGGEFFVGSYGNFARWAHLEYVPLPGGPAAIRQPWRMAVSYLSTLLPGSMPERFLPELQNIDGQKLAMVKGLVTHAHKKLLTSSAGRLFDGVAALLGVRQEISYEGQAAIELEQLALTDVNVPGYSFTIKKDTLPWKIELGPMFDELIADRLNKYPVEMIAARFHKTVADLIFIGCMNIRKETGIKGVVLSGGVFQNILLLSQTVQLLEREGFTVYTHSKVPANDGGISLGQAVIAGAGVRKRRNF
ncbi:carbamoyltransferase HypF [Thermanaerosceptrum fracticalcis]|uniref:Carbamoyltransferase n=1 Tax=Thermanaerosceptrum fracticalcis TaxID=1712410 RepID=A0A7G6E3W9_THEFR|nr:carbamoyltransferase HypF [Thermanaerosceptrum fracticalcis]QNB46773.1 carbamoyltransferase HypF [Thermanaerosceptrum fracticalcis]